LKPSKNHDASFRHSYEDVLLNSRERSQPRSVSTPP
jgi:hypothetical protein